MGAEAAVPASSSTVPPSPARASAWVGTLVIVAVIVGTTGGDFLSSAALGPATARAGGPGPGQPIRISELVSVRPAPGWEVATRIPEGVVLSNGTSSLTVLVTGPSRPRPLAIEYATEVLEPQAEWIQYSGAHGLRFPSGIRAFRVAYQGGFREVTTPLEGEVTALTTPKGTGMVFDGTATQGGYGEIRDEVEAMIGGTVLR